MIKVEDNQRVLFTSDTHYGHTKEFLWGPRNFRDYEEHDRCITDDIRHLTLAGQENILFHLGDIAVGEHYEEEARRYLPWLMQDIDKMYHIIGNHDSDNKIALYKEILGDKYECLGYGEIVAFHKWRFRLSHEPVIVNNFEPESKKFCLCGHSHTQDAFKDIQFGCYHCELDAHDNFPVTIQHIINELNMAKAVRASELKSAPVR